MMNLRNALFFVSLLGLLATPAAFAGVRASLLGVGTLSMPTASLSVDVAGVSTAFPSPTGKFGFGGGLLLEVPLSMRLALELGGVYYQRKFSIDETTLGGSLITLSFPTLEVPLTLNIHFNRFIMLSLGGYVTAPAGKGSATFADGTFVDATYSDFLLRNMNFGVLGGLGLCLPLGSKAALRVEGRYHLALQNSIDADTLAAQATASWKQNELQALVGLTFGGGMSSK